MGSVKVKPTLVHDHTADQWYKYVPPISTCSSSDPSRGLVHACHRNMRYQPGTTTSYPRALDGGVWYVARAAWRQGASYWDQGVEVWVEHVRWKYSQLGMRFEVGKCRAYMPIFSTKCHQIGKVRCQSSVKPSSKLLFLRC